MAHVAHGRTLGGWPLASLWWSGLAAGIAMFSAVLALGVLLPTLAGHVIGGTGLFALLAYGQIKQEI